MPFASEKIIKVEVSRHISESVNAIYVFHNGNSILYMVTNIYPKT